MKNAIGPLAGCDKEESEDSANDDDAASEKNIITLDYDVTTYEFPSQKQDRTEG